MLHELTDTLGSGLPGYHLCGFFVSRRAAYRKVDAILGIPRGELAVIGLKACAPMIFLAQSCSDYLNRLLFLKLRYHDHAGILRVAPKP